MYVNTYLCKKIQSPMYSWIFYRNFPKFYDFWVISPLVMIHLMHTICNIACHMPHIFNVKVKTVTKTRWLFEIRIRQKTFPPLLNKSSITFLLVKIICRSKIKPPLSRSGLGLYQVNELITLYFQWIVYGWLIHFYSMFRLHNDSDFGFSEKKFRWKNIQISVFLNLFNKKKVFIWTCSKLAWTYYNKWRQL